MPMPLTFVQQPTPQPTAFRVAELPPLVDADDNVGVYWTGSGVANNYLWGMQLFLSFDGGVSYFAADATAIPGTFGYCRTKLGVPLNPIPGLWDMKNSFTVRLRFGTLESVTAIQVCDRFNIALVGKEIIGYASAVLNADGSWTLSQLLRGIQGTDIYMAGHTAQDEFTLLSAAGKDLQLELAAVGLNLRFAGVSALGKAQFSSKKQLELLGVRIMPFAVCHAQINRPANGDVQITWVPRRRIGFEWADKLELGVDEPVEAYEVDIFNGATFVKTLTNWTVMTGTIGSKANQDLGIRQIIYPQSARLADGFTMGGAVTATIYQLSTRVGRGFPRTVTG